MNKLLCSIFLFILLSIFFVNKPIHIDEEKYLRMQKYFDTNLLDFYQLNNTDFAGKDGYFVGREFDVRGYANPPLSFYFGSIIQSRNIVFSRLKCLLLSVISILLCFYISRAFSSHFSLITNLLVTTPVFLLISISPTLDLPFFLILSLTVFLLVYSTRHDSLTVSLATGILGGLTVLTRYTGFFIIPLIIIHGFLFGKSLRKTLISALTGLLVVLAWFLFTRIHFEHDYLDSVNQIYNQYILNKNFGYKTVSYLIFIGSINILPLAFIFTARKYVRLATALSLIFSLLLLGTFSPLDDYSPIQRVFCYVLFSAGLVSSALILVSGSISSTQAILMKIRNQVIPEDVKIESFLSIWFVMYLLIVIFIYPFGAPRYLTPLLLPLIIILARNYLDHPEPRLEKGSLIHSKKFQWALIGINACFALLVLIGDYKFAKVYQDFPADFRREYNPQRNVYFTGDWGFRHYMENQGYKYLLENDASPELDDYVIVPEIPCPVPPNPDLQARLKLINTASYQSIFPVRVMNYQSHAGLYSSGFGLFPFSFSSAPLETFKIYLVTKGINVGPPN